MGRKLYIDLTFFGFLPALFLLFGFTGPILTEAASFQEVTYIEAGDIWRYFKGTQRVPSQWKEIEFDDRSWLQGPTGIGYGDGDDATVLSDMRNNYVCVYLRKRFEVDEPVLLVEPVSYPHLTLPTKA